MKLHLKNIVTKVGLIPNQFVEIGEDKDTKITAIFESPTTMATVVDVDAEKQEVQNQSPVYNTLIVCSLTPFIVFSVHYDHRYITRKFRNYR